MSNYTVRVKPAWITAVFALGLVLQNPVFGQITAGESRVCTKNAADYAGYTVSNVRIKANFLLFPVKLGDITLTSAQQAIKRRGEASIEVNHPFNATGYFNLQNQINQELSHALLSSGAGVLIVLPHIVNCTDDSSRLEVEYTVLGLPFATPSFSKTSFELPAIYLNKKKASVSMTESSFQLIPYLGYNGSRGLWLGGRMKKSLPSKLVKNFNLDADFSFPGIIVDGSLAGAYHSGRKFFMDHAEWRLGYSYSSLPAGTLRLEESTLAGQFSGSTKPFSAGGNILFRYGVALEGGRRRSNVAQADLPDAFIARSGYGAGKLYIGGVSTWKRHMIKASYGLQLGNTGRDLEVNYLRNLFDAAYRGRFLITDHRPLQLDLLFSAGKLRSVSGNIPVGERFYGGNVVREFIQGDSWRISNGPFIRSISQNRLNGSAYGLPIGGDRYSSASMTLSRPVWNKKLIPGEISRDQTVIFGLGTGVRSSRLALTESEADTSGSADDQDRFRNYNIADIQHLAAILADTTKVNVVQVIKSVITLIQPQITAIGRETAQSDSLGRDKTAASLRWQLQTLNQILGYGERITSLLPPPADSADFDNGIQYDIESMVLGYGNAIPAYFTGMTSGIASLKRYYNQNGLTGEWKQLDLLSDQLTSVQKKLRQEIRKIYTPKAEKLTRPTILYVERALEELFKEINIVSVSPVLMFDAAKLHITGSGRTKNFLYGLGPGIRLSLINFDIYAGYSFNLIKQIGENKGAFAFSIDITDLF